MSVNSLETLLNQMKGGSITRGWGAIAAFGRAQLNRLLEEQYLAWLSDSRFIPPISGNIVLADGAETVELVDLFLGKPVLSFASASLNKSVVTLTMNIVGGTYTAMSHPQSSASKLMSSFSISEEMGYKVELQIDLGQVEGEVDKRGRVTIDLAGDPDMTCNLGGFLAVQTKIAALIHMHLAALPGDTRTYELGLFDFSGFNPLSPRGFYLRTQKAPGAENPSSANYGEGCVLVFVRVKINDVNGNMPVEGGGFPYLIPDDQAAGKALYSASLVLSQQYLKLLEETQLDVLKNLLFPGGNVFVESTNGRHTPFDLLVLGNVRPSDDNVRVQPSFINLKGGNKQQFTALKSNGSAVNATWTVSNPIYPLAGGTIEAGGMYTSPVTSRMGQERHPIVVTAHYNDAGRQHSRSAVVLGAFESLSISPRVVVSGIGKGADPIPLTVTSLTGGELLWPTLVPEEGVLTVVDNNHALYTPPLAMPGKSLAVQTINVSERLTNERVEANIVLLAGPHNLEVEPPYIAAVSASVPIQFRTPTIPADQLRWEVFGEGSVDGSGVFTPPQAPTSRSSVVKCTYSINGVDLVAGFAVVQLTEQQAPMPQWSALDEFSIETIGGRTTAYTNGFQQIPVRITIETKSTTDGGLDYDIPISDAELATLVLVDKTTHNAVPFVHVAQDGIEYGSGILYAANKKRNRFRLYSRTDPTQSSLLAPPETKNNRVRTRELYIQLAEGGGRTFYARFKSAGNSTFNSLDYKGKLKHEVTVHGETFLPSDPDPDPQRSLYKFNRDRVAQDLNGKDIPPSQEYPNGDYFSYYLWSTDYWRLTYTSREGTLIGFVTSSIQDNISTIQWESELLEETFFSYTGCAFNPANFESGDSLRPSELSFDPFLWGLMREKDKVLETAFVPDKEPASGEFVLSLHRAHDMPYWYDNLANGDKTKLFRKHLDPGLKFTLLDIDGNRHSLQASFDIVSNEDSRNRLVLRRQP